MKHTISLLFACLVAFCTYAADPKYPVSDIPVSLKANVHTVFRLYSYNIEIKTDGTSTAKITEVRTILNKNGEENVLFVQTYNPFNKIGSIKGYVYDEFGKRIRSVNTEDAYDRSYVGYSLFDENRVKVIDPKCLTFPLTVEYQYDINLKQTLNVPELDLSTPNTSYETVEYNVTVPANKNFHFKTNNILAKCEEKTDGNKKVYSWTLKNIAAYIDEPLTSHKKVITPQIIVSPEEFIVEDTKGNTSSWKEFGNWSAGLISDMDKLPETTVTKIKELIAGKKTDFEKVKTIYEYMQQKTRYVSIQVGIGGWKPFAAGLVDKSSYGDCKALSNYTVALLKAAGINAYYTLINAGSDAIQTDTTFVSNQFNHVVVCVPLKQDTIWLETTNQTLPCGFNDDFTDDRPALLIEKDKSRIVWTRVYSVSENCINRKAEVWLTADNSGRADVKTDYVGLPFGYMQSLNEKNDDEKKRIITERISIPHYRLNSFKLDEKRDRTPVMTESLSVELSDYITCLNGANDLLTVNLMNKLSDIPEKVRNRKNPMEIRRSYMENDTIVYNLPAKYKIKNLPAPLKISNEFGEYSASVTLDNNKITYFRTFKLKKGEHPVESYTTFREFLENVAISDEMKIELNK